MIVVVAKVRTDPERRADLVRVGQTVASASRQEPGCLHYRVYQDSEDENAFVFVEEWESQEALEAHFATAHVGEFMAAINATLVAAPDVKFHTVASTMDLSDVRTR
jgi:quinol monooxygenase YgiN